MQYLALIGSVFFVDLLAKMSPGPDFIMCVRNSLTYSRRTGIWTALGFTLGICVHVGYSLLGIGIIIAQSILLFNTIKYIGAAYLIYIGVKSLLAKDGHIETKIETEKKEDISPVAAVRIGFLTNVLNPKATLFFLSLFGLIISPDTPAWVMAIIATIVIVDTFFWFAFVAIVMTHPRVRSVFDRFQGYFNKTFGALLILLGIRVALAEK